MHACIHIYSGGGDGSSGSSDNGSGGGDGDGSCGSSDDESGGADPPPYHSDDASGEVVVMVMVLEGIGRDWKVLS
eukprot:gene9752-biopygen3744